ncbi:MAG: tetratricopeptide repeat protein [bacterium]|nr:tetratricopeptide repeat protein [bacterium]
MNRAGGRGRRHWWLWAFLAVLALAGWSVILVQAEHSVFGLVPILDEVFYLDRAAGLESLRPPDGESHFMSPLYPLLAKAAGAGGGVPDDRVVPPAQLRGLRLLQIACWCGVVFLVRLAAGRLLPAQTPRRDLLVWLPSLLTAGYLPFAVYALTALVEAPSLLLTTVALVLVLPDDRGRPAGLPAVLAAGLALGAAGLLRGTAVALVPVAALMVATGGPRRRLPAALALAAAALAVQLPATVHNSVVEGRLVGPTLNGGVNLAIGNGPEANGFYVAVVPGDWRHDPAGRAHLAQETGRAGMSLAEADRIWAGRAWREMRARPVRTAGLWVKKMWLHLQAWEIDQLTPLAGWRRTVPALRLLLVPWFAVVALASAGVADLVWRRPPGWWRLPAWAGALLAVQSLFFVVTRYRLGLLPVLAVLAACGAAALLRRPRPALAGLVAGLLLAVPWGLGDVQDLWGAQALANEANRRAELGLARGSAAELEQSEELYRRAVNEGAEGPAVWLGLTALLQREGKRDAALDVALEGIRREHQSVELRHVVASMLQESGDPEAAARHLRAILVRDPGDAEALHNLVVLEAELRNPEEAERLARRLVDLRPDWAQSYLDLGVVLARKGDSAGAGEVFRRGLAAVPGDARLAENLRRLQPAQ